MNIDNISALAEQLKQLGFDDAGNSLVKRICFNPKRFFIAQKFEKANEQISFQLFFERKHNQDIYDLIYYDASLQKGISFAGTTLNGVDIAELEEQMSAIDWKKAFDFAEKQRWTPNDKESWENEQKIEIIIKSFEEIEITEEGKSVAAALKLKYWTGSTYLEIFDNIIQTKNKAEINQRFYCSDGQPGISVDEAYRFLHNRKVEKQMHAKRKETVANNGEELSEEDHTSSGKGLLLKRRLNVLKKANKKNATFKK